jgi:hypothetical protein
MSVKAVRESRLSFLSKWMVPLQPIVQVPMSNKKSKKQALDQKM